MPEEENVGQAETNNGPTVSELQERLSEAQEVIKRLRGTQSSIDRANAQLKSKNEELNTKLQDLQATLTAKESEFTEKLAEYEAMSERLNELTPLESKVSQMESTLSRMRIAAAKATESPVVAALIANNALPDAEDDESFTKALDNIISGTTGIVQQQVKQTLSGAAPQARQATGTLDPDTLRKQGMDLLRQKKIEEGLALINRAVELEQSK